MSAPLVAVMMGSKSDWEAMKPACDALETLGIAHDARVLSAHRTPDAVFAYVAEFELAGGQAIIAGAGGAAHLAGVIAAKTTLPVLAVPMMSKLNGLDSLLSMVQMPRGIPVATFAIGGSGAINAALFAVAILALADESIAARLRDYRTEQANKVLKTTVP